MTERNLMMAVLSMAAYENDHRDVGLATNLKVVVPDSANAVGFWAEAYSYNGETIIAFRGTNDAKIVDAIYGWGTFGGFETTQADAAADFFWSVSSQYSATYGAPYSANITLTGHSLGGALAGTLAGLYGKQAVVFDNIPYATAITTIHNAATTPLIPGITDPLTGQTPLVTNPAYQATLDTFYHNSPVANISTNGISGYYEKGQIAPSTGTVVGADVNWGTVNPITLHSMALLVLNMYADQNVNNTAWKGIANVFGPLFLAQNGGIDIAYSVISEGVRPNGDAAAKLLFNDANDLAPLFDKDHSTSMVLEKYGYIDSNQLLTALSKLMISYDQSLATIQNHVLLADLPTTDGLFVSSQNNYVAVSIDAASTALHLVSDTSAITDIRNILQVLAATEGGSLPVPLNADALAILNGAKFVVFAEKETVDASDAAHAFTDGYQLSDAAGSGAIILGLDGASHLTGTINNDVLIGGMGNDVFNGGNGNDLLIGDAGNDVLKGGDGNDQLIGGAGKDILVGGNGDDTLKGGLDSDILISGTLDNTPGSGGTANEKLDGGAGADYIVLANHGSDVITIEGGDTSDHLLLMPYMTGNVAGADGSLQMTALTGGVNGLRTFVNTAWVSPPTVTPEVNDWIDANGEHFKSYDFVIDPAVVPGIYNFNFNGAVPEPNFSLFGNPANPPPDEIWYQWYESTSLLKIDVLTTSGDGTASDYKIEIKNFHQGDYGITLHEYDAATVTYFVIDGDESVHQRADLDVGYAALIAEVNKEHDAAKIFTLSSDQTINGLSRMATFGAFSANVTPPVLDADHLVVSLNGSANDDTLAGTDFNEKLQGHGGNDTLVGLGGDDSYTYGYGDGHDTINENSTTGGTDKLILTDIDANGLTVTLSGNDVVLTIAESSAGAGDTGSIVLLNSATTNGQQGIEQIQFTNGTVWNHDDILAHLNTNTAPVVSSALADHSSAEDAAFIFTVPTGSFTDPNGNTLTYTATLADGTALPIWLFFNTSTQTFSGTPPQDYSGSVDVKVMATDGSLIASDIFTLTVTPVNDAPIVALHLVNQASTEDTAFSFSVPAGSITDVDNAVLTYSATLADGTALPAWINFNASTQAFSGVPPQDYNGSVDVKVMATDGSLIASDIFTLTITPVNDAPIVALHLVNQASAEDTAFSFSVPAGSFTDVDNAVLTYSATLADGTALPAWINFNASTQAFIGTPPQDWNSADHGTISIKVTASDGSLTASDTFILNIIPVNDAPVARDDGSVAALYNAPLTIATATLLANDTDVDSPVLSITSVSNATHGTVSLQTDGSILFTPDADYIGTASFTYMVDDGSGGTASAIATLDVHGVAGQIITGTSANNVLTGTAGDDMIFGHAGNDTLNGNGGVDTLIGGIGNDIYVVDSVGDKTIEVAGEGTDLVQSSISWTLGANLENLTLTGTAKLNGTGNELANVLTGNAGNNILDGGLGADKMAGGLGDDTYIVDNSGDVTTEAASAGNDTVIASLNWTLTANIENLVLSGIADLNGTGNTLANSITGTSGNNTINGGAGADSMVGALGNDTYMVDNLGDVVVELAGQGIDTVQSSISYALSANVENLTLTGTANINGTGNELDNIITGNTGINILDGGLGADTLIGNIGNDTYIVDNIGDTTVEAANSGTDLVKSSITWTLGNNLEKLTLTGIDNINGTGNSAVNVITGNAGDNILNGAGGLDTLIGGLGNDTYIVDNLGVTITEAASAGTDLVMASLSWTLAANLENLTLTGTAAIDGTGNTLNNIIIGNSADNVLNGGAGADSLIGGFGNDTYVFDNVGDVVTEFAGQGVDLVQASISDTLAANVENLTLTGTANINGTGNEIGNIITGNSGNNILDGGLGADTLIGNIGNDTYVVDNVGDTIVEAANAGTDLVKSSISWTLGDNLENLTLTGTDNINGTGNALNNIITGNTGDNVLNGGGGTDALAGGLGNDTYMVNQTTGLTITEAANAGTDTVISTVTYTLGANLENLTLAGTTAINGTGNTLNNILVGNASANTLNGGAGNDTITGDGGSDILTGGTGNDTFIFTDLFGKDVVTDFIAGAGATHDILNLNLGTAFDTYAELMAAAAQVGADTVFTIDANDTITLSHVLKTALTVDDFTFI